MIKSYLFWCTFLSFLWNVAPESCSPNCGRCDRGWTGIHCNIPCNYNCLDCTLDGDCERCYPGYYVQHKSCVQCRSECYQNDSTTFGICDRVDGGCVPACDQIDGECTLGCKPGWSGKTCNSQCPVFCTDRLCNRDTRCCTNGCKYTYYGGCECKQPCSSNCVNGICYQNNTCTEGCKLSHWGPDCNQECSDSCAQGPDNSTDVCDMNGICVFGCKKTFMGPNCLQSCPVSCPERDCNAVSGHCLKDVQACSPNCAEAPSDAVNSICNVTTLTCLYGCKGNFNGDHCDTCKQGWTGDHCNITCDYYCLDCTLDGGCEQCYPGYYVKNNFCKQCQITCYQNDSTTYPTCTHVHGGCVPVCDHTDGKCTLGCNPGWYGKYCDRQCHDWCINKLCTRDGCCTNGCKYPNDGGCGCDDPCSSNCVNGTCYQNKTCMEGCDFNYWGADCNQECSDICAHGQGNSTSICDRNGMCIFGCKNTLQPCPVKCLERDCNAISGHCPQVCNPNCAEAPPDTAANISNETALTCLYGCKGNFDGVKCDTCKRGWTGIYCNITCDYNCLDCTLDGGCEQCYPGYYVRDKGCNQCWITCYQNDSTFFPACNDVDGGCKPVCDQNDGGCTFRCDLGWYGKMCNARCPIRCIDSLCTRGDGCCTNGCKYQTKGGCQCDELCGSNCANGTCYQNKTCMDGCELNHWGPDCNQECSDSCAQGQGNSTAVCDRNGICVHGCKKTFMGSDCLQSCPVTCPERDCNATSGHCLQAENSVAPREGTTKSYFLTFCLQLLIYFRLAVY